MYSAEAVERIATALERIADALEAKPTVEVEDSAGTWKRLSEEAQRRQGITP